MKQLRKYEFYILIIIVIIAILWIGYISLFREKEVYKDYSEKKANTDLDYVYSSEKVKNFFNTTIIDEIPQFNLEGSQVLKLNDKIIADYKEIRTNNDYIYNYKYYISNNIVSLIVDTTYSELGNTLYQTTKYYTYNYDLENDRVISNKELLDKYKLSDNDIKLFLENKYINYYLDMINEKMISDVQVSFYDFLEVKGIKNYLKNVSYAVEEGSLILYRPFLITTSYNDFKYFTKNNFRFVLVKNSE